MNEGTRESCERVAARLDFTAPTSTHRGHKIEISDGPWVYSDTRELVSENPDRACGHCGLPNTPEGHDGCLGTIAGAMNACCGHGVAAAAYVQTIDGAVVRGCAPK